MSKHTPGPWIPDLSNSGPAPWGVCSENGDFVCSFWDAGILVYGIETRTANARLIVAAPDLLEAASKVLTADHGSPIHLEGCAFADGLPCTCGIDDLRSAVSKALGTD